MIGHFKIAIIGSGPAGLSAAARSAELGVSHILLEAEQSPANTIRKFQKGKFVMAEPSALPLRTPLTFGPNVREKILETWAQQINDLNINLRVNSQVHTLQKVDDQFLLTLSSGETLTADKIILAIGLQGNLRKLGVAGEDALGVQYQLEDPDDYQGETIVIVGGGDTAIENAMALIKQNRVILINRKDGFINCKESNYNQLISALKEGDLECRLDTTVEAVNLLEGEYPLEFVAKTFGKIERIPCHRVIARLGADPPRQLLESFGVKFPDKNQGSTPELSSHYESNVPGLFIVGALTGHQLIKQALNQGYEAVEHIVGNAVEAADEPLLREKFSVLAFLESIDEGLHFVREHAPLLQSLSSVQLREFMMESQITAPTTGETIFCRNDYSTSFFNVLAGSVSVYINQDETVDFKLQAGDFFGEMGLVSGRRRSATIIAEEGCLLLESPRLSMLKLSRTHSDIKKRIDHVSLLRSIRVYLGMCISDEDIEKLANTSNIQNFAAGENLFREGEPSNGLYLIRRGSVTVSRNIGGREIVLSYTSAGNYVGDMALISGMPRYATVCAAVATEAVLFNADVIAEVLERNPEIRREMENRYLANVQDHHTDEIMQADSDAGDLISFLVKQGIGEATDVLLIDESICTRCDNCVNACADTHSGTSRLDRQSGPTYDQIRVPASCRHCEHPHCMKDCPPDAIHRSENGEVFINDTCIGCGNCVVNCPYDVIQMATIDTSFRQPSIWRRLLWVSAPLKKPVPPDAPVTKQAVKCDMCKDLSDGPACVRSCPTGAALRVTPQEFLDYAVWRSSKSH